MQMKTNRINFLLEILKDKQLDIQDITDSYYKDCYENVKLKRQSYINKGRVISDKDLRTQIKAEFSSILTYHYKDLFKFNESRQYTLTEKGIEKYNKSNTPKEKKEDKKRYVKDIICPKCGGKYTYDIGYDNRECFNCLNTWKHKS